MAAAAIAAEIRLRKSRFIALFSFFRFFFL